MGAPRERYFCPSLSAETVWSACRDVDLEALVTVAARNHTSHEQLVRAQHEAVVEVNFPPLGGQVDYAAIAASWDFNSNWMGLS